MSERDEEIWEREYLADWIPSMKDILKITYYIGNHNRWLHEQRSRRLDPHTHRFVSNIDAFRGLPRDIEIINLGPVETTREKVRELRARGFEDIKF